MTAQELLQEVIEDAKYVGRNPSDIAIQHLAGTVSDFWRGLAALIKAEMGERKLGENVGNAYIEGLCYQSRLDCEAVDMVFRVEKAGPSINVDAGRNPDGTPRRAGSCGLGKGEVLPMMDVSRGVVMNEPRGEETHG